MRAFMHYLRNVHAGIFQNPGVIARFLEGTDITHGEPSNILRIRDVTFDTIPGDETAANIAQIRGSHGGLVFTDVDATNIHNHPELQKYKDDLGRIIFNFPHVPTKKMHIGANRDLLKKLFMSLGQFLGSRKVPVIVTLCSGQSGINEIEVKQREWANSWQIVEQAAYGDFVLVDVQPFKRSERYKNAGYRAMIHVGFRAENANTFAFERREAVEVPVINFSLTGEPTDFLEPMNSLDFWAKLHESNPLKRLIDLLVVPFNARLRVEINDTIRRPKSDGFIHIYADNVPLDSLQKVLPDMEIETIHEGGRSTKILMFNDGGGVVDPVTNLITGLNLTRIAARQGKTRVRDLRILFSKYCHQNKAGEFCTGSLHSREHTFDISFWIPGITLSSRKVVACALRIYGLLLKSIELKEVYRSNEADQPLPTSRKISYCYQVVLQSTDLGLSRHRALNEMYLLFRQVLAYELDVDLR